MRKDKRQASFVNIGSSSLLVIFLVLCMVTFAILSVSSARSDYSFSERLAEHKKGYYEASARAEVIAGKIDDTLSDLAQTSGRTQTSDLAQTSGRTQTSSGTQTDDKAQTNGTVQETDTDGAFSDSAYAALVRKAFDGTQIDDVTLSCDTVDGNLYISYQIPAGEKQVLDVRLLVTDYTKEETFYQATAWQVVPSETWEGDESLNLMPVIQ